MANRDDLEYRPLDLLCERFENALAKAASQSLRNKIAVFAVSPERIVADLEKKLISTGEVVRDWNRSYFNSRAATLLTVGSSLSPVVKEAVIEAINVGSTFKPSPVLR